MRMATTVMLYCGSSFVAHLTLSHLTTRHHLNPWPMYIFSFQPCPIESTLAMHAWIIQLNFERYWNVLYHYVIYTILYYTIICIYFGSADGEYVVTTLTKAVLHHTGKVYWTPPAIFKSSCEIDVRYFPFDQQTCFMKFGSWTYDGDQVRNAHKCICTCIGWNIGRWREVFHLLKPINNYECRWKKHGCWT